MEINTLIKVYLELSDFGQKYLHQVIKVNKIKQLNKEDKKVRLSFQFFITIYSI